MKFPPNSIIYEQLLYNMFGLLSIGTTIERETFKRRDASTEMMISSLKHLVIDVSSLILFSTPFVQLCFSSLVLVIQFHVQKVVHQLNVLFVCRAWTLINCLICIQHTVNISVDRTQNESSRNQSVMLLLLMRNWNLRIWLREISGSVNGFWENVN